MFLNPMPGLGFAMSITSGRTFQRLSRDRRYRRSTHATSVSMATTAALDKLVHTYTHVSDEGRATIDAIAEAESRYANLPKS